MSGQIEIQPSQLNDAAKQARAAGSTVNAARSAAGTALPGNAFGIMCSPLFLPIYSTAELAADALMDSAANALTRAADGLDKTAEAFIQADEAAEARIAAILS